MTTKNVTATKTKKTKKTAAGNTSTTTLAPPRKAGGPTPSDPVASVSVTDAQALEDAMKAFASLLGGSTAQLTKASLAKLPKPKKNPSSFVNAVIAVCQRFKIAPEISTFETATANQALVAALVPVIGATKDLLKTLKDTSLVAEINACAIAAATYRVMVAKAKSDPALGQAIAPIREMLRPKLLTPAGTKTVKRKRSAKAIAKTKGAGLPGAAPPPTTGPVTAGHA